MEDMTDQHGSQKDSHHCIMHATKTWSKHAEVVVLIELPSSAAASPAGVSLFRRTWKQWPGAVCVQVVFRHPHFIPYFRKVTPEEELGGLNIGSRPARYSTPGTPPPADLMFCLAASNKPLNLKLHIHRLLPITYLLHVINIKVGVFMST